MRITKVEPILFDAGLDRVWCFVRVETDEGVSGIGESTTTEPYMAAAVVRRVAEWVVGRDPSRIQELWQDIYRRYFNVRGGPLLLCAMSGIEHALWDIKGKVAGLPVYDLLGGALRDRVPTYVNHMFFQGVPREPAAYAERAAEALARGYHAVKIEPCGPLRDTISRPEIRRIRSIAEAVRETIGPDREFAIDIHARFNVAAAIDLGRALTDLDLYFFEEPVPPENVDALKKVRHALPMPLATGERLYTKWGVRELLESQAVDYLQVDVAHCGGLFEARMMAAQAEVHYVAIMPHSWYGPVSLAASLHLDACVPNMAMQERPVPFAEPPQQRDLLEVPLRMEEGALVIPTGLGLGIALNEDVLAKYRIDG